MTKTQIPYTPQRIKKAPTPKIVVAVSIPVYEHFHAQFGYSLAKMELYTGVTLVADGVIDLRTNMIEATYIHRARNDLAAHALKNKCTHLLWLDADMKFPQDALFRLLSHGKAIVGCNYANRRFPIHHVAYKVVGEGDDRGADVMCRTTEDSTGLEQVDAMGFGLVLMESRVLAEVPFPWFTLQQGVGEDIAFCRKAKEHGFSIWIDHDLSKEVVHFGPMGYTYRHAEQWLEEEWKTQSAQKPVDRVESDSDVPEPKKESGHAEGEVTAPSTIPVVEGIAPHGGTEAAA